MAGPVAGAIGSARALEELMAHGSSVDLRLQAALALEEFTDICGDRSAAISGPLRRRLSTCMRTSECSAEFANTCRRKDTTRPSGSRSRSIKTFNLTAGELMAPRASNAWINCERCRALWAQ